MMDENKKNSSMQVISDDQYPDDADDVDLDNYKTGNSIMKKVNESSSENDYQQQVQRQQSTSVYQEKNIVIVNDLSSSEEDEETDGDMPSVGHNPH